MRPENSQGLLLGDEVFDSFKHESNLNTEFVVSRQTRSLCNVVGSDNTIKKKGEYIVILLLCFSNYKMYILIPTQCITLWSPDNFELMT